MVMHRTLRFWNKAVGICPIAIVTALGRRVLTAPLPVLAFDLNSELIDPVKKVTAPNPVRRYHLTPIIRSTTGTSFPIF